MVLSLFFFSLIIIKKIITINYANNNDYYLQDYVGRDLKDPRLDMIISAETTSQYSQPLCIAAGEGNLEEVKRLTSMSHNPMGKDEYNNTALHYAALNGRMEVLEYLIEDQGCNPASLGQYGMTPLHMAADQKHLSIVQFLISKHQVDSLFRDDDAWLLTST